jgi:hypothetical protein
MDVTWLIPFLFILVTPFLDTTDLCIVCRRSYPIPPGLAVIPTVQGMDRDGLPSTEVRDGICHNLTNDSIC